MSDRPPRDLIRPEYGTSDVRPGVEAADRQEARVPEAFILAADILGAEPLPFNWRRWQAAENYTGHYPLRALLRAHVYRLAIPDIGSHHALASRLEAQPRLADLLGFTSVPGRDTFRRLWASLEPREQEDVTGHAAALRRRVATEDVPGTGALKPQYDESEELEEIPPEDKQRAVEHLRAFCYEQLGFERAQNTTYHRDELLDLQAEVSREQDFVQGTIEDRWTSGEQCHTPRSHFRAIENRDLDQWKDRFQSIYETQIQAAKNAGMFQRPVPIHIDATIIPYYKRGQSASDLPDGVTGNVKARGTHYGYKHVTVSAQDNGRSVCLASIDLDKRADLGDATKELVKEARKHVDIDVVSMDSEFGKADLTGWLDNQNIDFILHLPRKGTRLKRALVQMTGHFDQCEYQYGKTSYHDPTVDGHLVVERDYDQREPDGPEPGGGHEASSLAAFGAGLDHGSIDLDDLDKIWWMRWRPYFTNIDIGEEEAEATIRRYKRRWAIETKYRVIKDEFLGRTTSRDYTVRTFFWLFAVMMYNAWVLVDVFLRADYPDLAPEDRPAVPARTFAKQFFAVEYG